MIDYSTLPLDRQHADFIRHELLVMPIAGTIAWAAIGVAGALLPMAVQPRYSALAPVSTLGRQGG